MADYFTAPTYDTPTNKAPTNEAPTKETLNVVFDIVNSVKGGSGKSTVALQLAAFWASQPNSHISTGAYVIDLDLRGTSWRTNYNSMLARGSSNIGKRYINDLMYGPIPEDSVFWNLKVKCINPLTRLEESAEIPICIGDPEATGEITPVKSDLLENAVYKIIRRIISHNMYMKQRSMEEGTEAGNERKAGRGPYDEIHIIFDMPPSYEVHAERVITFLLMDKASELFKQLNDEQITYKINMLMVYAISKAHLEQNVVYIRNLLKNPGYSSNMNTLIEAKKLSIYFIGNDISNALEISQKSVAALAGAAIKTALDESKSSDPNKPKKSPMIPRSSTYISLRNELRKKQVIIKHLPLELENVNQLLDSEGVEGPKLYEDASIAFTRVYDLQQERDEGVTIWKT